MIHSTHTIFGIFLITILYEVFPFLNHHIPFIYAAVIAAVAALVPDLDHPRGYLSRGNWAIISIAIRRTTEHRGWTHSLIGAVIFTVISIVIFWYFHAKLLYAFPFFVGYLSHLLSDSLNPTGVKWLWPFNERKLKSSIRTGSEGELIFHNLILFSEAGILALNIMYQGGSLFH